MLPTYAKMMTGGDKNPLDGVANPLDEVANRKFSAHQKKSDKRLVYQIF